VGRLSWGQLPSSNDRSDGSANTGGGSSALINTTPSVVNTTAYGSLALYANTSGFHNTATGAFALEFNTTGANNTASGIAALGANTIGSNNTALGYQAGINLTSGSRNIYLGHAGMATESATMRLGQNQTRTFIAGVYNVSVPVSSNPVAVFVGSTGQLGDQVLHGNGHWQYRRSLIDSEPAVTSAVEKMAAREQPRAAV
jgi:trimeric autotransporter adhesin